MIDFEPNVCLVYKVFNSRFSDFRWIEEDLIQEGMIGLWNACQTYDSSRGTSFSTYAVRCISNQMGMYIRKEKKYAGVMSLDALIDPDKGLATYEDMQIDEEDQDSALLHNILEMCKDIEHIDLLQKRLEGYTIKELSEQYNVSSVCICERLKKVISYIKLKVNNK